MHDYTYLARQIVNEIKRDFKQYHLSMNLVNTIEITKSKNYVQIHIPAQVYDMWQFVKKGVIIYKNRGSYASQLNEEGSYIFNKYVGHHIGYVDNSIDLAVEKLVKRVQARDDEIKVEHR